jgi:hypothetical protein
MYYPRLNNMKKFSLLFIIFIVLNSLAIYAQPIDNPNSLDSKFSNPSNLNDKQMDQAKDFVHKGIKDRLYKQKCKEIDDCKDKEGFPLEEMIAKAYGVLGMISGGLTKPSTQAQIDKANQATAEAQAQVKDGSKVDPVKPEKSKQTDYCIMLSTAYESVGGMIQQSLQKKAENTESQGDAQLQALVSLRETHKARAQTAKYQSYVYGAVSACYAGLVVTGTVSPDASLIIKLSGAAALTALFIKKAKKHEDAMKKVEAVIAALEGAGKNCNPWTKTSCFCSEMTSKTLYPQEYQEVCILNKGNFETPKVALGCAALVENKVEYDKECTCKKNNTCLRSPLKTYNPQFGLGSNLMNESNKIFDMLGSGEYDQGELDRATLKQLATANGIKFKNLDKLPTPNLTDEQKKMAKELSNFMPPQVAAIASAAKPMNSKLGDFKAGGAQVSNLSPEIKEKLGEAIDVDYKSGGGPIETGDSFPEFTMPKVGEGKKEDEGGTEVMNFAERATAKAEISNSADAIIFDIISNRYKASWKRLETNLK